MRRIWMSAVILLAATVARGDDVKPEDLKKLYNDTLLQLKAAQERKTELAVENQRLTDRVADLEAQLRSQTEKMNILSHQAAMFNDKTDFLREHYTAWTQFVESHPMIKLQWDLFVDQLSPWSSLQIPFIAPAWPLTSR